MLTPRSADAAAPRANVGGFSAKNRSPARAVGRRRRAADAIVGHLTMCRSTVMNEAIISMVISTLVGFFSLSAKEASKKMGEKAGERLYEFLRKKFGEDSFESQALERLKEKPNLKERQVSFRSVLQEEIQKDPGLLESLLNILEIQDSSEVSERVVYQSASNVIGNVTQVGGDFLQNSEKDSGERERKSKWALFRRSKK